MHKSDLVKSVAANSGMSGPSAEKAVNAVFDTIKDSLKKGDKVTLTGFGTFEVTNQAARVIVMACIVAHAPVRIRC